MAQQAICIFGLAVASFYYSPERGQLGKLIILIPFCLIIIFLVRRLPFLQLAPEESNK